MDIENNAAGRLYVVLGELRTFQDEAISAAWEKILGVPSERIGESIGPTALFLAKKRGTSYRTCFKPPMRRSWPTLSFPRR